jgi:hypothetical protein
MRTSTDPHNALWTTDNRNPVTLPLIGRCGPGLRYKVHRFGDPVPPAPKPTPAPVDLRYTRGAKDVRLFTPEEDAMLLKLRREGLGFATIGLKLQRGEGSCRKRLRLIERRSHE